MPFLLLTALVGNSNLISVFQATLTCYCLSCILGFKKNGKRWVRLRFWYSFYKSWFFYSLSSPSVSQVRQPGVCSDRCQTDLHTSSHFARNALMSPCYLHVLRLNQGERFQLKQNHNFFKKSKEKILFSTE